MENFLYRIAACEDARRSCRVDNTIHATTTPTTPPLTAS